MIPIALNHVYRLLLLLIAISFTVRLVLTIYKYPILQAFSTHESSKVWLMTTILDYYVQTLAFAVIVLTTEKRITGFFWVLLNCILGSPVAIMYLLTKQSWRLG